MPSGSCFCGATGDPIFKTVCHCLACRKITGSLFGYVFTVPVANVTITADVKPKTVRKLSDQNTELTSHFCPECGTTLFRTGGSQPEDMLGIRAGIIDDIDGSIIQEKGKPNMEVYVERRPPWVKVFEGVDQRDEKYELVSSG